MPAAVAIEYDTNRRLVVVFDEIAVVGCDSVAVRLFYFLSVNLYLA